MARRAHPRPAPRSVPGAGDDAAAEGDDRLSERLAGRMAKVPAIARAATRKAGSSMVVVTEYDFDAPAWRAGAGRGPEVLAVEVGTGGGDWSELPLAAGPLQLQTDRLPGIIRITLAGAREPFALGDVRLSSARRRDRQRAALAPPQRGDVLDEVGHLDQRLAALDAREHRGFGLLDLRRALQAGLECVRGAITIPSSSASTTSPGDTRNPPRGWASDARRDVAAPRHRHGPARPQRKLARQPAAITHVPVDDDPAQPATRGLGGQQFPERGQRRSAGLHDQHIGRPPRRRSRAAPRGTHPPPRPCTQARRSVRSPSAAAARDRRREATCRRRTAC